MPVALDRASTACVYERTRARARARTKARERERERERSDAKCQSCSILSASTRRVDQCSAASCIRTCVRIHSDPHLGGNTNQFHRAAESTFVYARNRTLGTLIVYENRDPEESGRKLHSARAPRGSPWKRARDDWSTRPARIVINFSAVREYCLVRSPAVFRYNRRSV